MHNVLFYRHVECAPTRGNTNPPTRMHTRTHGQKRVSRRMAMMESRTETRKRMRMWISTRAVTIHRAHWHKCHLSRGECPFCACTLFASLLFVFSFSLRLAPLNSLSFVPVQHPTAAARPATQTERQGRFHACATDACLSLTQREDGDEQTCARAASVTLVKLICLAISNIGQCLALSLGCVRRPVVPL